MDIENGAAQIAEGLGFGRVEEAPAQPEAVEQPEQEAPQLAEGEQPAQAEQVEQAEAPAETPPPPKSWAKEYHELWGKIDPAAQKVFLEREEQMLRGLEQYKEFHGLGKQLHEVVSPYKAMLTAQGIDEVKAVQFLLNAHYRLTNGTPEQRRAVYEDFGRQLGIVAGGEQQQITPEMRQILERQQRLEQSLQERDARAFQEARSKVETEVNSFAAEKDDKGNLKHPYFDEVVEDMLPFIQAGKTIADAYERAVRANPVTFAKERARIEAEAKAKLMEKAKPEVSKARQASSANVRNRDTQRAPTEFVGSMEETMKDTLGKIRSRAH